PPPNFPAPAFPSRASPSPAFPSPDADVPTFETSAAVASTTSEPRGCFECPAGGFACGGAFRVVLAVASRRGRPWAGPVRSVVRTDIPVGMSEQMRNGPRDPAGHVPTRSFEFPLHAQCPSTTEPEDPVFLCTTRSVAG